MVVGGSWTTVKEQMAGLYARGLAAQGFAALAFDHRNFGESEGEPHEWEDPSSKIADFRSAAAFLQSLPIVDGDCIGALGVCASAGYLAHAVAADGRFRAFAVAAAWMQTPEAARTIYGGEEGVSRRIAMANTARTKLERTGEVDAVPAYDPGNGDAAMFLELPYYEDEDRGAAPAWRNRFAVQSWRGWLTFDALKAAPHLQVPTLLVHSDDAALPDLVRRFHDAVSAPKALHWTQGAQIDFYDQEPQVTGAVGAVASWFRQHLGAGERGNEARLAGAAAAEVATRMLHSLDTLDWKEVRAAFADEVRTDYTSLFGGEPLRQRVDELIDGWRAMLPGFDATQHITGPFVTQKVGDRVTARCAVIATHVQGDARWVVVGRYEMGLRFGDRWVIDSRTLETAFVDGDTELPNRAREVAASRSS